MMPTGDLFQSPLVLRIGDERAKAVRALRANGIRVPFGSTGNAKVLGLYTNPTNTRAVLVKHAKSGRVLVERFGRLTAREIAFLHREVPSIVPR